MKRQEGDRKRAQVIPVWTYGQARKALPYLASVMKTIREYRLEARRHQLAAARLADTPGRADRTTMIAEQEEAREARRADERSQEGIHELQQLGIFCLDPIRGQALVPFARNEQLAWFVYDLFDPELLTAWRYHDDDMEMRRPISEIRDVAEGSAVA
jgi:hypothetical protein